VLTRQLHDAVQAPSARAPYREITPEIDAVVLRALSRDPNARHASITELAAALDHAFAVAPLSPSVDLIEVTATRDFWGGETLARPAPALPGTDAIIDGALERVRALLDRHDRHGAIDVLETTLKELKPHLDGEITPMAWRLETVLAALYEYIGRNEAATRVARLAYAHAQRSGSESAKLRARELFERVTSSPRGRLARGSKPLPIGTRAPRRG